MKRWGQGHWGLSKLHVWFQGVSLNLCLNDLIFSLATKLNGETMVVAWHVKNGNNAAALVEKQTWSKGNSTATVTTRLFYNSEEQEEGLGTTPPERDNIPPTSII